MFALGEIIAPEANITLLSKKIIILNSYHILNKIDTDLLSF